MMEVALWWSPSWIHVLRCTWLTALSQFMTIVCGTSNNNITCQHSSFFFFGTWQQSSLPEDHKITASKDSKGIRSSVLLASKDLSKTFLYYRKLLLLNVLPSSNLPSLLFSNGSRENTSPVQWSKATCADVKGRRCEANVEYKPVL